MKLLLDQNLSFRVMPQPRRRFPGSEQTARAGFAEADDISIWNYAGRTGLTIVTHDSDFAEMAGLAWSAAEGRMAKMWNQPTPAIETLLGERTS